MGRYSHVCGLPRAITGVNFEMAWCHNHSARDILEPYLQSHTQSRCSNDFSKAEILQGNFELCEITINSPYFAYQQTACESYFMHSYIQFSVLSNSYMPLNYRAYNHFMFTIRDNNYMHALMPSCCVKCRHEFFCTLMNTAGSDRKRKCYLAYGDMTRSCISTKDRWLLGFLHVAANVVL